MQRELGRRRLTAVTGAVGVGAAAIAALVGFTRPAPVHHTQASRDGTSSIDGTGSGRSGHDSGQHSADGQGQQDQQDQQDQQSQQAPQSTDQGPDQVSSGS